MIREFILMFFYQIQREKKVKDGQQIVVNITDWGNKNTKPTGEVLTVLEGIPGEHSVEIRFILAEHELPNQFSDAIEKAAQTIPTEISEDEIIKRKDFRKVCTFTIDPQDVEDFDDAISIQQLKNGSWEIGVHIADVSYYVQKNEILLILKHKKELPLCI